jgi:hypothetical protein
MAPGLFIVAVRTALQAPTRHVLFGLYWLCAPRFSHRHAPSQCQCVRTLTPVEIAAEPSRAPSQYYSMSGSSVPSRFGDGSTLQNLVSGVASSLVSEDGPVVAHRTVQR